MGRDSVGDIATAYGLERDFRHPSDRKWDPPNLLSNGYRISLPGVKRPDRGADHTPTSSAEVLKEECGFTSAPPLGFHGTL